MPWRQVWENNPSDEKILLHENPPEGFSITGTDWGIKYAKLPWSELIKESEDKDKKPDLRHFYFCRYCKGWIEGDPYEYHEDDIGPLCGRRGTTSSCIRCGSELGFSGMVS